MKEEKLLEWIDEQVSRNNATLQSLSMTGQQHALSDAAQQIWNRTCRDNEVLIDLKRVVIDWHQVGEDMKEGF